jgi:thiol-disulfide isomerase/thioredoxin
MKVLLAPVVLVLLAASATAKPTLEERKGAAHFDVHFKDGRVIACRAQPVVAFNRLSYVPIAKGAASTPLAEVDLERSRKQWAQASPWHELDRCAELGGHLDGILIDEKLGPFTPEPGKWVLIELWTTYCVPCRRHIDALESLAERRSDSKWLQTVVLCIGTDREAWATFVSPRRRVPGISHAYVEREILTWPDAVMKGRSPVNLLVDPAGRIRHCGISAPVLDDVLTTARSEFEKVQEISDATR